MNKSMTTREIRAQWKITLEKIQAGGAVYVSPDVYESMLGVVLQCLASMGCAPVISDRLPARTLIIVMPDDPMAAMLTAVLDEGVLTNKSVHKKQALRA